MRDRSHIYVYLAVIMLVLFYGCSPTQDLQNENTLLQKMVDSLRTDYYACIKQSSKLEEKIDSLKIEIDKNHSPVQTATVSPYSPVLPTPANESFQSQYQNALHEFNEKNYTQSLPLFLQLAKQQPASDLSDNCEYWAGESYYALGRYTEALDQFASVLKQTGSDKADDALMMRGNCYLKLSQNEKAKEEFKLLLEQFPNSEYALRAKEKLVTIK